MMEIAGAFNGSIAERILALNSNARKNRERIEELKRVFADSNEKAGVIRAWHWALSIAIPLIIATIGLQVHPGVGPTLSDWRWLCVTGLGLFLSGGFVIWIAWGKDLAASNVSYAVNQLLLTHNAIIDVVYRVEKLSEKLHDLNAGLPVLEPDEGINLEPKADILLQQLLGNYCIAVAVLYAHLKQYGIYSDEYRVGASLVDETLCSSTKNMTQLLASRPWLDKYYRLLKS